MSVPLNSLAPPGRPAPHTLYDTVAPTSGVAVPNPASAREEGSGTPAGGRESGRPGGRAAAARARGPGGTAQPAHFFLQCRVAWAPSANQHGPEVVDVRAGRPRDEQVPEPSKAVQASLRGEAAPRVSARAPAAAPCSRRPRRRRHCPRSRRSRRCRRRAPRCRHPLDRRARGPAGTRCCARPGRRRRTVTVVSPPDSMTTGGANGRSRVAISRAIAACIRPISRASPSIASDRITAGTPAVRAAAAAASSDRPAEATTVTTFRANRGSPGPGAAPASPASQAATAGGSAIDQSRTRARASASVTRSGTVGPEATCAGSSPGTSETTRLTTRAGAAAAASRPPLMPETCLRIAFITEIGAPEASSARLSAASSSSVSAPAGRAAAPTPRRRPARRRDRPARAPRPPRAAPPRPRGRRRPAPDAPPPSPGSAPWRSHSRSG